MRIFTAVRHANDARQYYGGLWSANFYPALRALGHEIVESQIDLLPSSRFMHIADKFTKEELETRARVTAQILDEVRAANRSSRIDCFLSYFYNAHFDPAGFDELRRMGIPSVNFYCNSIYQFEFVADIAAKADFSWHAEKHARDLYLKVGANPIWVQMGADSDVYRNVESVKREAKACFVGQRYADRDRWLAVLIRANIPVDIYGSGWGALPRTQESQPNQNLYLGRKSHSPGGMCSYARAAGESLLKEGIFGGTLRIARQIEYRRRTRKLSSLFQNNFKGWATNLSTTFASYEICLNFSNVWADGRQGSALIPHVRLRDFEAPMCRTCYITGHSDEIAEFYDIGREIDTYSSPEELLDKMRFYFANPEASEKLREAGYRRALRDHTWKRRFEELFHKIDLHSERKGSGN